MTRPKPYRVVGMFISWAVWTSAAFAGWAKPELLTTADELKAGMEKGNWVAVDCRSLDDYIKGHIPGAISFGDQCKKVLRDATSRVYQDVSKYEKLFGKVGISNDTNVVFYYEGLKTLHDAAVAFWIMEYLGSDKAHVLNGGIDAWRQAGNRLDNKPVQLKETTFNANVQPARLATTQEVLQIANGESDAQLIDSRTAKEYGGKDIRALRGGHVPHTTLNMSDVDTLRQEKDPKTGEMEASPWLDSDVAAKAFGTLDKDKRAIAHCQTGTRSAVTYLQFRALGFKDPANWDESWRVYGSEVTYPVADEQWFDFDGMNKKIKALEKEVADLAKAKK